MVSVAMARGGSRGVGWGLCILPSAIFKNVFDEGLYNFSVISNLFGSHKSYDSDKPCYVEAQTRRPQWSFALYLDARVIVSYA